MMIASLHQSELYIVETSDTVLIAKHSIYIRLEIQSQSFHGILWMQYPPSDKRRETVTIAVCPLHIFIWKSSRMLLKKLYFIVLFFAFKLMSIKYTLTCVQHMWACNTTFAYSRLIWKIHCYHSTKEGAEIYLFLIIALKQLKLILNIIVYTSMMKKNHLTIYLLLVNLSYQRK